MNTTVLEQVRESNSKLREMLRRIGDALAGRAKFGVEEIREISKPIAGMASVVAQAKQLRAASPEIQIELEQYAQNLGELNKALERVNCDLLARCARVQAQRGHLEAVRNWAHTWQQTQPPNR